MVFQENSEGAKELKLQTIFEEARVLDIYTVLSVDSRCFP